MSESVLARAGEPLYTTNNISEAARVLGMHRRSLKRKLTKYPSCR